MHISPEEASVNTPRVHFNCGLTPGNGFPFGYVLTCKSPVQLYGGMFVRRMPGALPLY